MDRVFFKLRLQDFFREQFHFLFILDIRYFPKNNTNADSVEQQQQRLNKHTKHRQART